MDLNLNKAVEIAVRDYNRATGSNMNPEIVKRLMYAESNGDMNIKSGVGAIGLFQLMPETAGELGVNPHDPVENIRGGVKYFGDLVNRYKGDYNLAVAAYNTGAGNLDAFINKVRANPANRNISTKALVMQYPIKETTNHVSKILYGRSQDGKPFIPNTSEEGSPVISKTSSGWVDTSRSTKVTQDWQVGGPSITQNELNRRQAEKLKEAQANPQGLGATSQELQDSKDYINSFGKGIQIGLAKGSEAATIARNQSIDTTAPGFQEGFMLSKLGKAGVEVALTNLGLSMVPGGQLKILGMGNKVKGTIKEIEAVQAIRRATGAEAGLGFMSNASRGAGALGGANLATNVAGDVASAILPGTNYKSQGDVTNAAISTIGEAGITAVAGGALNGLLAPRISRKTQQLAATQAYNDFDKYTSKLGGDLMQHVNTADDVAKATLEKIARAKYEESLPLKAAMNANDKMVRESKDLIPLSEFPDSMVAAIEEASKSVGASSGLVGDRYVKDLRDKLGLTGKRSAATRAQVRVADLPEIKSDIEAILDKTFNREAPHLKNLAQVLNESKAKQYVVSKLPEESQRLSKAWEQHKIKFGDPNDPMGSYKNLNDVYEAYDPKKGLQITGAKAREILTDSSASNRALNNKIGEFVDNKILDVEDVAKVFQGDAAKHAYKTSSVRTKAGPGDPSEAEKFIKNGGSPHQYMDEAAIKAELQPIGGIKSRGDVLTTNYGQKIPDIQQFSKRLSEKQDALSASLGNTGRAEAEQFALGSTFTGSTKQVQNPIGRTMGNMQKVSTIAENREVPGMAGAQTQISPYSETSLINAVDSAKKLRASALFGVQPVREIGQDFAGMLFSNGAQGPIGALQKLYKLSATKGPNG